MTTPGDADDNEEAMLAEIKTSYSGSLDTDGDLRAQADELRDE
jgi:hypothetical protein